MEEYCEKKSLEKKHVRFMFKGKQVFEADTPKSIGMKNGDNIDAYERFVA